MARYSGSKSRLTTLTDRYTPPKRTISFLDKIKIFLSGIASKIKISKSSKQIVFSSTPKFNLKRKNSASTFNFSGLNISSIIYRLKKSKFIVLGIIAALFISFLVILISDFYNVQALAHFKPNITTKIYDKNGILISELFRQKREIVSIEKIPEHVQKAFVAIEDNEFYDHFGINIKGIVRAFFINVFSGRIRQGGSTITQQLSKILLTTRERSIYRKIKEAFISIMIEIKFSKEEILSLYLNQIFLGQGAYGVESASLLYFNKHVWELNLAECSLLATLPSAPNLLSPIRHPKRSMQKHKVVMAKMVELGFIMKEEAEKSYSEFWEEYIKYIYVIDPTQNVWSNRVREAPWFTEYIRRKLIKKYGEEKVYEKGLLVYTTLDIKKQKAAQEALERSLKKQTSISSKLAFKNEDYFIDNFSDVVDMFGSLFDMPSIRKKGSRRKEKINDYFQSKISEELEGINYLVGSDDIGKFIDEYKKGFLSDKDFQKVEGCLISINPKNGYIEAMVGGSEFSSINQLNRPMQSRRQPGSSIKPLLYTAAIESGEFTPATAILDSPIVYLDNEGGDWLPENYEGEYYGLVRLRRALARSINIISIRVADKLGIDKVLKYYSKLLKFDKSTAKKRMPRNFSIALGSIEVSPFEMARAYSIIANGGKDVIPFSIRYIEDRDGNIIENGEKEIKDQIAEKRKNGTIQIIKPETAQIMVSMLRSVIDSGTGGAASPGRPAAGKTGTTNNWKDAWFVGFVPQLATAVWVGYDKLGLSLGIGQSGGSVAAPVWGEYMRNALADESVREFPVYVEITELDICKRSGLIPSYNCRHIVKEIFVPEHIPEKECEMCTGYEENVDLTRKGPRENISEEQKKAIIKNIHKDTDNIIINNIENELLGN